MLDRGIAERIMAAVDAGFEAQVGFTADLVAIASRRGREAPAQDLMARAYGERGYDVDRWRIDVEAIRHLPGFSNVHVDYDNAYNTVGVHRATQPTGRSLILNGHIDVVPEGPAEMWSRPPYRPHREGRWLYGRGAGDMKAGLVANLFALDALRAAGFRPAADVVLQSVVEEECTGNGALACLERGYRADAALITEPTDGRLVSAQVGVLWFQVKVRGFPVHVYKADSGANAIEAAFHLVGALKRLEADWNDAGQRHAAFASHHHPINFNVGRIAGGDWASSVPSWCTFDCRIALYPGDDLAARRAEIEACVRQAAGAHAFLANSPPEVVWNGFLAEGYELDLGDAAVAVLRRSHAGATGDDLRAEAMTGTTDARFFGLYAGMPALVYGPRAENIHGFDERVDLDSVRSVTRTVALFVAEWCGLEKA